MGNRVEVTFNDFAESGAEEALKAAIVATATRVHAEAVQNAPVNKKPNIGGALRNSLMWKKGWNSDTFSFPSEGGFNESGGDRAEKKIGDAEDVSAYVGTAIEYAAYQEFGTRFMPAQPYLRPAVDAVRGRGAAEIAKRWGPAAMRKEFDSRRKRTKRYGR